MAQVLRYVALVVGDLRFEEFRATIARELPQAREVAMTIAEELRQEGRAEGRAEMSVKLLVKLLTLKFGESSRAQMARIEAASEAELERYVERVLTAQTIDAVLAPR